MKTAPISKLKAKLSDYLASVKRGEDVLVTDRGKPVARIVPLPQGPGSDARARDLVAQGLLRPPQRPLPRALSGLPVCKVAEGTVSRLLDQEREEAK